MGAAHGRAALPKEWEMSDAEHGRRQSYRTETGGDIQVWIRSQGAPDLAVDVLDLSAGGAGLLRGRPDGRRLTRGEPIQLVLTCRHLRDPLIIAGQVVHVRADDDPMMQRLGIAFDEWDERRETLVPRIRAVFNKRRAVRVEPRPGERIGVQLKSVAGFRTYEGELVNLSTGGLAVRMPASAGERIEDNAQVEVRFRIPGEKSAYRVECTLRHRFPWTEDGGRTVYMGLQLPAKEQVDPSFLRQISSYVMDRQREIARHNAEIRSKEAV